VGTNRLPPLYPPVTENNLFQLPFFWPTQSIQTEPSWQHVYGFLLCLNTNVVADVSSKCRETLVQRLREPMIDSPSFLSAKYRYAAKLPLKTDWGCHRKTLSNSGMIFLNPLSSGTSDAEPRDEGPLQGLPRYSSGSVFLKNLAASTARQPKTGTPVRVRFFSVSPEW